MGGKDGRHVDVPFSAERYRKAGLPLVEMRHDGGVELVGDVLRVEYEQATGDVTAMNVPRRGTTLQDIQTRSSRWSHDRSAASVCRRGSTDRPSTRRALNMRCPCRRG